MCTFAFVWFALKHTYVLNLVMMTRKWCDEMKWISSAIVHPKINMICVNVRFCADKNRRHLNKLCHHHHLDADGASVQLSFIHENVTETYWYETLSHSHTDYFITLNQNKKKNYSNTWHHSLVRRLLRLFSFHLAFSFHSTVANQLNRYIMLINFSFEQNQIFISLFRSIWEIKDERNMVPERLQRK